MWLGFKFRRRRHMRVEFVVGSLLCSESFFFGYSGFPLSSKTKISKFQFDQEAGRRRTTLWKCYLQIIIIIIIIIITLLLLLLLLYYILCCKNRNWVSPDLMQFWIFFVWLLFCFCFCFLFCFLFFVLFCFFFNNPISSSICKLPIRSEIYNCTSKNTNKVSVIIIIIIIIIKLLQSKKRRRQRGRAVRAPGLQKFGGPELKSRPADR